MPNYRSDLADKTKRIREMVQAVIKNDDLWEGEIDVVIVDSIEQIPMYT
jgi:hypothetical protein